MNNRLEQFIAYTKMSKASFACSLGWSGQYLNYILKVSFGIVPLRQIQETYPELNARWLITGEGEMIEYKGKLKKK